MESYETSSAKGDNFSLFISENLLFYLDLVFCDGE